MSLKDLTTLYVKPFKKIDVQALDSNQKQQALKFSNDRFNRITSYVHDSIVKTEISQKNQDQSLGATQNQLNQSLAQLHVRKEQNRVILEGLIDEQKTAQQELITLQNYVQLTNEPLKKKIAELKQQIINLTKERQDTAETLDCESLASIKMKNKDQDADVNQIFKWLLLFFYKDPISNYYWPNFKKEAFGNDKGFEFKQRCFKTKAVDMKKDELQKTDLILSIQVQVCQDPLLNSTQKSSVEALFTIIQLIRQTYILGTQIQQSEGILNEQISLNTKNEIQKDLTNARMLLLKERVAFQDHIYNVYDKMLQQVLNKFNAMDAELLSNKSFVDRINNQHKSLDNAMYNNNNKSQVRETQGQQIKSNSQSQGQDQSIQQSQSQGSQQQQPTQDQPQNQYQAQNKQTNQQDPQDNNQQFPPTTNNEYQEKQTSNDVQSTPVEVDYKFDDERKSPMVFEVSALPPQQTETGQDRDGACQSCNIF